METGEPRRFEEWATLTVAVPASLKAIVKRISDESGQSMGALVRSVLTRHLADVIESSVKTLTELAAEIRGGGA